MRWVAVSALLLGAMAAGSPAYGAGTARCEGRRLPVVVEDVEEAVRLRIRVGLRMDPGSVEVDLEGRRISISAREADGQRLCSGGLWLRSPVVEEQPLAEYEDGWLTITLAKERASDDVK